MLYSDKDAMILNTKIFQRKTKQKTIWTIRMSSTWNFYKFKIRIFNAVHILYEDIIEWMHSFINLAALVNVKKHVFVCVRRPHNTAIPPDVAKKKQLFIPCAHVQNEKKPSFKFNKTKVLVFYIVLHVTAKQKQLDTVCVWI